MEAVEEVLAPQEKSPREWQSYWQREKSAADKRVREFIKEGNKIVARYIDAGNDPDIDRDVTSQLNLFHKNVKTTMDMLYGRKPKVDVSREHKDPDDDVARVAAYLLKRILESGCESPVTLRAVLQDRLLPGLGVARVRYEVETATLPDINGGEQEVVADEYAPVEYVHWQDFRWGWGRTWDEIPWVGFRVYLPKEDVKARFGETIANNIQYKAKSPGGEDNDGDSEQVSHIQEAEIWEFWHKREEKVFWWSAGAELILDIKDDPLQLENFWPMPRPLTANLTTSMYLPTPDFKLSQDLYNEIDILQTRIAILTEAIRVVGVYDQSAGNSVGRMLTEGRENELIPVENWAMFTEGGGTQGKIQWFPVQEVVGVLDTLAKIQQNKIQQLYEITGMSTLMRGGDTGQYTSDGTNQLSAKFGSISIQALQDEFAQFASDLQSIRAEVIAKHYLPRSIYVQSNAQFIPQADKPLVEPALQMLKSPDMKWRIEIAPESVAMVDYAQLQNERIAYLNALATFIQSSQAMLKQVPESMPVLLEFMKFGLAGFKGADYMEGMLDQAIEMALKTPPKQEDDGEQQKMQIMMQGEMQKIKAKSEADLAAIQAKSRAELQKIQMDNQANLSEQNAKNQGDMQKIMADLRADMKIIAAKLDADLQREAAQSEFAIAEETVQHRDNMIEMTQEHRYTLDQLEEQEDDDGEMETED